MKAIILGAGTGSRLRPLTETKPKCLVQVAGKSLLEHQLDTLKSCNVFNIHLIGGYLFQKLQEYDVKLHLNKQYEHTNMVYTLFCASSEFDGADDIIIAYGDIVYQKSVLKKLISFNDPINLVIDMQWQRYWEARMENPLEDAETLKLTDNNKVVEIGKKPLSIDDIQGQYTGLIKIRADHVKKFRQFWFGLNKEITYDGNDADNIFMTSFLQLLIDNNWDVRAVAIENGWAEIDCESDLKIATRFWSANC